MCGICCVLPVVCPNDPKSNIELEAPLLEILKSRGPDLQHQITLENGIIFYGSVLWQQGECPTRQPLISNKFILLFNGDIFNASKEETVSDTSWLLSRLDECENETDFLDLFKTLQGPYSLILYDKSSKCLYFARDPLGRNSLLLERSCDSLRILSSSYISEGKEAIEVPALGVYKLSNSNDCTLHPWNDTWRDQSLSLFSNVLKFEIQIGNVLGVKWYADERRKPLYCFSDIFKKNPSIDSKFHIFEHFLSVEIISETVNKLLKILRKSVADRVLNTPKYCSNCIIQLNTSEIICKHAKIGVLFSGGIDCTILAAIANEFVASDEPIDLINVAFEAVNKNASSSDRFNVPDRLTAVESCNELTAIFPERQWNLIETDVDRNELQHMMNKHIRHLIYPLETVLDESLGCAFWFASRGTGNTKQIEYTSSSRVILVGSGADELFGGYIRHRNAFNRCKGTIIEKIKALDDELYLDWRRIPTRNLGRDDRIIADNGRTSRAPFIEERLVQFVSQLHPLEICSFDLDQGVGDKLLLRLVGYRLGLRNATQFKKRAIQFGSRVADKNQNANDASVYLVKSCLEDRNQ